MVQGSRNDGSVQILNGIGDGIGLEVCRTCDIQLVITSIAAGGKIKRRRIVIIFVFVDLDFYGFVGVFYLF